MHIPKYFTKEFPKDNGKATKVFASSPKDFAVFHYPHIIIRTLFFIPGHFHRLLSAVEFRVVFSRMEETGLSKIDKHAFRLILPVSIK